MVRVKSKRLSEELFCSFELCSAVSSTNQKKIERAEQQHEVTFLFSLKIHLGVKQIKNSVNKSTLCCCLGCIGCLICHAILMMQEVQQVTKAITCTEH